MEQSGEITQLLQEWRDGNKEAFERLMPVAYTQLRGIAASHLRRENPGQTLQATALVHELYLRLLNQRRAEWKDRSHFFAFAAKLMRMILIDHVREQRAQKRGGVSVHVPLSEELPWINANGADVLDLDRALHDLEAIDPRKVRLVELRHLLGCTAEETAELLHISKATVDRDLKMVRAWLYQRLRADAPAAT